MHIANFAECRQFEPSNFAVVLRTSAEEIAMMMDRGKDALQRRPHISSNKTQRCAPLLIRDGA